MKKKEKEVCEILEEARKKGIIEAYCCCGTKRTTSVKTGKIPGC